MAPSPPPPPSHYTLRIPTHTSLTSEIMIFPPPFPSLAPPHPPLRPRHPRSANPIPRRGLTGGLKTFTTRLRAWKLIPSISLRRHREYTEKQLFGDDKDYESDDDDDGDGGDAGYVFVKKPRTTTVAACAGERRANTAAWEYGSRRMMF